MTRTRLGRFLAGPLRAALIYSTVVVMIAALVSVATIAAPGVAQAASPLACDQNTLYGIDSSGAVKSINVTTGATSNVVSMSPAYNALGVTANGTDAWAFDGADGRIVHYTASTGTNSTITAVDSNAPSTIIRGAINPATGIYYYAGFGSTSYLGAYNTTNATKIGKIGSLTGLNSDNGDLAFSSLGLLFVVSGDKVFRVNGTVPTSGGNVSLATSTLATLPRGTNSPGIAFSTDGYLYVSSDDTIIKLDPASGAKVGSTLTISGGFSPLDLASCNYPNTISVQTDVVDRVTGTDQFNLSVTGGSISGGNTATTSGTTNGIQSAVAGAALAIPTRSYTVSQTAAGTTTAANYITTYSCSNVNTGTVIGSGSGTTATFTFPAATTSAGTDVVCTFTNTPTTATLLLTKTLGTARSSDNDQFTMAIRSTSASGPVLNPTDNSTTTGTGSTVTAGTGTTATTTVVANRTYYLTESLASGSSSALGQYGSTITCTDANSKQTGLPNGAVFNGSLSITPVTDAAISCSLSNSTVAPTLRVNTALGGPRYGVSDQFTAAIHAGSPSGPVVNVTANATTRGSGAVVTPGTGTTGAFTGTAGTTYFVTNTTPANGTRYAQKITCVDAKGFQSGLPTNAVFDGFYPIAPVAGAEITCTVTNTVGPAVLSLAKTNPASLTVGVAAAYSLTVTNVGGQSSAGATVVDKLPPNIAYASASGTGWTCSAAGTVAAGQLVTCTGPVVTTSTASTLTINVTVNSGAAGTTAVNRAIVDTTGGPNTGDPTACAETGTPPGCAVTTGLMVDSGISLSLAKTNPASLTVGVGADYSFTVTNSGTGAAATATVTDALPANLVYSSASGADCTASGQVLTCTVTGPIEAAGGTASFTVNVVPAPAAATTTVTNRAAVDTTGGTSPVDPAECTATDTPAGCAVPPAQTVVAGVGLSLTKTNPASLTVGVPADYTLTVANNGGTEAASATVADVLPADLTYNSADGVSCTATGQVLTCTVTGPIAAGGTQSFTVSVTPQVAAAGTEVVNRAAVDPSGGAEPVDPSTCVGVGAPDGGCAVTAPLIVGNGIDLSMEKSNPASLTVGEPADYSFTVTNNGVDEASSATVRDRLPDDLTYDSAFGATCSAVNQELTCTVPGPIAAGGGTASFSVTVTPAVAASGATVANLATVDPTGGTEPGDPSSCTSNGTPAGCAVTPGLAVGNGVDLALAKSNPASLTVGVPADYALTVTNNGSGPASSATVQDVLPDGVTFNSASGATCSASGQVLTCTVAGPIAAGGGTASFTVNLTPQPAAAGVAVVNRAAVDVTGGSTPTDPSTCTATDSPAGCAVTAELAVGSGIDLALSKSNPASLTVGVASDYTLTVTNNGTGPASSATVQDVLPDGVTFNSASGATCSASGQVLSCDVPGPIAAGGGTASLTVVVTPAAGSAGLSVVNRATVDTTGGTAPTDPSTCTATDSPAGCAVTAELAVGSGIDLALAKSNPASLTVGVASDYTLTVTNNGTGPASSATVQDVLPDDLTFNSAAGATCTAVSQVLTCDVPGPIAAGGGTASFTVVVTPAAASAGSTVVNKASVDSTGGTTPTGPATCEATGTPTGCAVTPGLTVADGVGLSLAKSNPGSLTVGVAADYTLTVTNDGTGPVGSATVTDALPAGLTFNSASGATCSAAGQVVTCTVAGPIAAGGGAASFTVNVTPQVAAAGASVVNLGAVDPDGGTDPVEPSSCIETDTPAGCAVTPSLTVGDGVDLALAKTNPASLVVGVPADYTLTVTNNGTGPAASATVVDVLPAGLTFNSASGATCSAAGQVVTCTVAGPIAAGESASFGVNITPAALTADTAVVNKAAVDTTGGTTPTDPSTCEATGTPAGCAVTPELTVGNGVNLALVKSNPASLTVGVAADYTLTVTNNGTGPAASATVVDVLPADLTFNSASGATCSAAGQVVTCTVAGPIAAGGSKNVTVRVTPTAAAGGASLSNSAAVDPDGGTDPVDPSTCTATDTPAGCAVTPGLTVADGVELSLTKSNPVSLTVGVAADYTLTVTNSGTGPAASATVVDVLPAGLTFNSASGATCSAAGQVVTCTVAGPIAAAESASFGVNITPAALTADTAVVNKAAVDTTGGTTPTDPSTCEATGTPAGCAVTPELTVGNGVNLALVKSNPASLTVGVAADYTLTVTNNGTGPAASATVVDVLPADLTFNSASGATCSAAGQVVTCTVAGPIAAGGGAASFTVNVTPQAAAAGGSVVNMAAVDPDGGTDPVDPSTCTGVDQPAAGCAVTPPLPVIGEVDLTLTKSNPEVLTVGEPAAYALTVTNNGTISAKSATVTDLLPANLTFEAATGATCSPSGQVLTCTVAGTIAPGGSVDFGVTVLPQPAAAGTSVVNRAAVDPTGGNEPVDPTTCTGRGQPSIGCAVTPASLVGNGVDLSLTKTNPAALTVGVPSAYTLEVTNNGSGPSAGATVTDTLPAGLQFDSADGATCTAADQVVTCAVPGTVAPFGGSQSFTLSVIPAAGSQTGPLVNKASVDPTGGNRPTDPVECQATDSPTGCAVAPAIEPQVADLTLVKTATLLPPAGEQARAGDQIGYQFLVTNAGNVAVNDISVSDPKVGMVSCPVTSLAGGESTTCTSANYTVTQADVDAGSVINTATAAGTPEGCLSSSCRVLAPQSAASTMTLSIAGVSGSKTAELLGGAEAGVGATVRYTVMVTNTGTVTIARVTVDDPMLTVTCPEGALAPGASVACVGDYTMTDADVAAGELVNTAVVNADGPSGQQLHQLTNTVVTGVPANHHADPDHRELPYTGLPGRELFLTGLLLLAAGLGLLTLSRRRRQS